MMIDPYASIILDVGDMVRHPMSGHVGLIVGKDITGMWRVEWFASDIKEWKMLKNPINTIEYDSVLHLMAKAEMA